MHRQYNVELINYVQWINEQNNNKMNIMLARPKKQMEAALILLQKSIFV